MRASTARAAPASAPDVRAVGHAASATTVPVAAGGEQELSAGPRRSSLASAPPEPHHVDRVTDAGAGRARSTATRLNARAELAPTSVTNDSYSLAHDPLLPPRHRRSLAFAAPHDRRWAHAGQRPASCERNQRTSAVSSSSPWPRSPSAHGDSGRPGPPETGLAAAVAGRSDQVAQRVRAPASARDGHPGREPRSRPRTSASAPGTSHHRASCPGRTLWRTCWPRRAHCAAPPALRLPARGAGTPPV